MTWSRVQLGMILVASVLLFRQGIVELPECVPRPEPVAGWVMPFSVAIGDSVVGWYPNENVAVVKATQVAYDHPVDTVRVASIHQMVFRRTDGTRCTYRSETDHEAFSRSTRSAGVPWVPAGAGVRR